MKKHLKLISLFLISTILLPTISCNVNDGDEFTDRYSYQISEQSVIRSDTASRPISQDSSVTILTFNVEPGDSLVFRYKHDVIAPPNIADGGFSETLVFQLPSDSRQFEFRDDDFENVNALYRQSCFCELSGAAFKVTSGVIRGERLSPLHWIIRADVTIQSPVATFNVAFEKPFYVD